MAVLLSHFFRKHVLLNLGLKRPTWKQVKAFVSNGFGVGSAYLFQGLVMLCFNSLLLQDSQQGIFNLAVFGIIYTIGLLPGAFFEGGSNAMSTVVSIFSGEKDKDSILAVWQRAIVVICSFGLGFTLLFLLFPQEILTYFGLSGQVTAESVLALRIFALSLVLTGVHVATTAYWQAIGRYRWASGFSALRNFGLMLVLGVLLIPNYQLIGLAATYVLTELICFVGVCIAHWRSDSNAYLDHSFKNVHRSFERYYPIETSSMSQIATDLEQLCEGWGMAMKQSFFINLIVEELVLNIIKFGLDGNSNKQHYIAVKVLDNDGEYILRIRDNVKTYNPFDSQGDEIDAGAMRLITTKANYYDYQRKLIFNYLYLIL